MDKIRNGRFTSSGIAALMSEDKKGGFGKPALTYIEEKNFERKLGRSITSETSAKPTAWGRFVERRVFELLSTEYKLCSTETIEHNEIKCWAGSPDAIKYDEGQTVVDIKCPYTIKSFCQLSECKTVDELMLNHKEGETYFWQLVSNAILTNSRYAELIVYCPYKSELEAIREEANQYSGDQNKIAFINWADNSELPYINDNGYYQNIHIIRFEVLQVMKDELTARVEEAEKLLIPYYVPQTAEVAA